MHNKNTYANQINKWLPIIFGCQVYPRLNKYDTYGEKKYMQGKRVYFRYISKWLPIIFGCHHRPDRSFFYHGHQFPICARCTGELTGIISSILLFWFWHPSLIAAVVMMIPMIIDGFTQRLTSYESTNFKRFITGFLFGVGITALFSYSVTYTFKVGYKYGMTLALKLKK